MSVIPRSWKFLNADATGLAIRGKEAAQAVKEARSALCLCSCGRVGFEKDATATLTSALPFR